MLIKASDLQFDDECQTEDRTEIYFMWFGELDDLKKTGLFSFLGYTEAQVFGAEVKLTMENGGIGISMSPTIETDATEISDIDWADLEEGIHYSSEIIPEMLKIAGR